MNSIPKQLHDISSPPNPSATNLKPMGKTRPFIPRQMDEAGLTPAQFRVACRVARRGLCNESIARIAKGCQLAVKTVKAVLVALVARNVLSKQTRYGHTSVYQVKAVENWQPKPSPKDYLAQTAPQAVEQPSPQPKRHPNHLAQTAPHKGNPFKVIPLRGGPPILENNDAGLLAKDRERLQKQLQEARDATKPDQDLVSGLREALKLITDEFRRRGQIAHNKQANEAAAASHGPANGTNHTRAEEKPSEQSQSTTSPEKPKVANYWNLPQEERAKFMKPSQDSVQQLNPSHPKAP